MRVRTGARSSSRRTRIPSSTRSPAPGSRSTMAPRRPRDRQDRSRRGSRTARRAEATRWRRRGGDVHRRSRAPRKSCRRSADRARCRRGLGPLLAGARVCDDPRDDAVIRSRARGRRAGGPRRASRRPRRALWRKGPLPRGRPCPRGSDRWPSLARAPRSSGLAATASSRGRSPRCRRASTDRRRGCRSRTSSARASRARSDPCSPGPRAAAGGGDARYERGAHRRRSWSSLVGRSALRLRGCVHGRRPYHRSSGHRVIETTIPRGTPLPRIRPWLGIAAAASFVVASAMAVFWAPTDAVQGDVYRILYVHVPLAWLAYLAFVVVLLASVAWLWTKRPFFDAVAVSSAEIGVLFTGLFLVAGSIWAKPTWGVWWTWEPRLVTTAIMFVMYVGYLLLRGLSTDFSRRATRAAVFGIIAVIDVPIVHLSVLWANSLHQLPTVLRAAGSPALDSSMLLTLMVSLFAYTLIYAYFMSARVSLERARQGRLWTQI